MQEHPTGTEPLHMGELLERLITEAETETRPQVDASAPRDAEATQTEAPQGIPLQGLGLDPKLLMLLPQLMSGLRDFMPSVTAADETNRTSSGQKDLQTPPILQLPSVAKHMALISALKPYLGEDRRRAAEGLLGMCRTLDTLQKLGGYLPLRQPPNSEVSNDHPKKEV